MTFGTKTGKKEIIVEFLGAEIAFWADESILNICDEIKTEAKLKLQSIKSGESDNDRIVEDVEFFLKKGIQRLAGDDVMRLLDGSETLSLSDYTEMMCRCISEIGFVFGKEREKGHMENDG